jgi:DNA primase
VDPDLLFLQRGIAAYAEVQKVSLSAMEFACRALLPSPGSASSEQRSRAAQGVLSIIAAAESEVSRAAFVSEAAALLRLPAQALQADLRRAASRGLRTPTPPAPEKPREQAGFSAEHDLLRLCLHFDKVGKPMSTAIPHDWIDQGQPAGVLLNRFLGELENGSWPGRDHLEELMENDDEKSLVASLLFDAPAVDDPFKVAREGIRKLRDRALGPRIRQIELALAKAPSDFDDDPSSLLRELADLQRQLRQPVIFADAG